MNYSWIVVKTAAAEDPPCSPAIIRRHSVTAGSDRWVGLWVLCWCTNTKFHWNLHGTTYSMNKGFSRADKLITGLQGEEKERKRQRKKQREREEEGDWHVCIISLLLTCFWSSCCCSADDETLSASSSQVTQDLWWDSDTKPSTPSHHNTSILQTSCLVLEADVCSVLTVQECWTNSRADRYDTVKGAWNNLCYFLDTTHEEIQHRKDLVVEFLWDTISQSPPYSSLVYLQWQLFPSKVNLPPNSTLQTK